MVDSSHLWLQPPISGLEGRKPFDKNNLIELAFSPKTLSHFRKGKDKQQGKDSLSPHPCSTALGSSGPSGRSVGLGMPPSHLLVISTTAHPLQYATVCPFRETTAPPENVRFGTRWGCRRRQGSPLACAYGRVTSWLRTPVLMGWL